MNVANSSNQRVSTSWQPSLKALSTPDHSSLLKIVDTYVQSVSSQYGTDRVLWTELLADLLHRRPFSQGNSLTFVPTFCSYSHEAQSILLAVMYIHRRNMSLTTLIDFVNTFSSQPYQQKSEWIDAWTTLFQSYTTSISQCHHGEYAIPSDLVHNLCAKSKSFHQFSDYKFTESHVTSALDICHCLQDDVKNGSFGAGDDMHCLWCVSCTFVVGESDQSVMVDDAELACMDYEYISQDECTLKLMQSSRLKQKKVDAVIEYSQGMLSSLACNIGNDGVSSDVCSEVNPDLLSFILQIKDQWFEAVIPSESDVNFLMSLSPQQLELMFKVADVSELSDVALNTACQMFMTTSSQLSYECGCVFVCSCLLPRLSALCQPASRLFVTALTNFANKFSHQMIHCLLLPTAQSVGCNAHQADILLKLVKDAFSAENQLEFLSQLLMLCSVWSEHLICVIQFLVDTKMVLSDSILNNLVGALCTNADVHSTNLKFGKLLLASVSVYGTQMNGMHIQQLLELANTHRSFMKKLVITTISKLQS